MADSPRVEEAIKFLESTSGEAFIASLVENLERFRAEIKPSLNPEEFYGLLPKLFESIDWKKAPEEPIEGEGFLKPIKSEGLRRLGHGDGSELALSLVTMKPA